MLSKCVVVLFVDSVDRKLRYSVGQHSKIGPDQEPEPPVTEPDDALGERIRCTTSRSLSRHHLAVCAQCTRDAGQHVSAKHWRLRILSSKNDGNRLANSCMPHRLSTSELRQCGRSSHSAPLLPAISIEEYNGIRLFRASTTASYSLFPWCHRAMCK